MSIWNDKAATEKILAELPPQPEMKTYEVQWVRVEHKVAVIEVHAQNPEDAADAAREVIKNNGLEDYELEVVYADEFINDVEEVK